MKFPCPNKIDCEGVDFPTANLSAEDPDTLEYYSEKDWGDIPRLGYAWNCDRCHVLCVSEESQQTADDCAERMARQCVWDCIRPPGPDAEPPATYFYSAAQTCFVECGSGDLVSFALPAGYAIGETQEAADSEAYDFACLLAQFACVVEPIGIFGSVPQTCSITCLDGTIVSFTTPANISWGLTQAEADARAYVFACLIASKYCPGAMLYKNNPQSCTVACADGGTKSYRAPGNLFSGETQAAADASAYSFACLLAGLMCSSDESTLISNTPQTCTQICSGGDQVSFTAPAGVAVGETLEAANAQAYRLACLIANMACPGTALFYLSTSQTCSITCPDGSQQSYTLEAGLFPAFTQEESNAQAYAFACKVAAMRCDAMPNLFYSSEQTCIQTCPDGSTRSFTLSAGNVIDLSQAVADAAAYEFACAMAALICNSSAPPTPPLPPLPPPPVPPGPEPPGPVPTYSNVAMVITRDCPLGGVMNYPMAAGTVVALSQSAADAAARSLGENRIRQAIYCLDKNNVGFCLDEASHQVLTLQGGTGPFSWEHSAMPNGLGLAQYSPDGRVFWVIGTPGYAGTYSLNLHILDSLGNWMDQTITIYAALIVNVSLPGAIAGVPYSQQLSVSGVTGSQVWELIDGSLPSGLTLSQSGLISGTPSTVEAKSFTVKVTLS